MQFLDKLFSDCEFWRIDKAVDVPVISIPGSCSTSSRTSGFNLDAPAQFFFMSSSPLDDDVEGLGDDDHLLEFGAADEETKMEEVSDFFALSRAFFVLRPHGR